MPQSEAATHGLFACYSNPAIYPSPHNLATSQALGNGQTASQAQAFDLGRAGWHGAA
jgi:hypothetical protein